eukprot:m.258040 g.258040  ORF g.258040 m.258040 type:complete len:98 (+) comp36028_c0_seq1:153-446(+)
MGKRSGAQVGNPYGKQNSITVANKSFAGFEVENVLSATATSSTDDATSFAEIDHDDLDLQHKYMKDTPFYKNGHNAFFVVAGGILFGLLLLFLTSGN